MRVKHIVAEQHVPSMIHEVYVWHILVLIFLDDLFCKDTNSHTSFDSCHSEADSFCCIWRNRIISKCKALISQRWFALSGISSSNMNSICLKLWTIDHKELKLENSINILIKFINSFNVAFLIIMNIAFTIHKI